MNYSGRYPGLFGGATQGKRTLDSVTPPPDPTPNPDPVLDPDPPLFIGVNSVLADDVVATEALAKKLADDHTVAQLKEIATELGIEFRSGVRELALATLIAEHQLKENKDGTS